MKSWEARSLHTKTGKDRRKKKEVAKQQISAIRFHTITDPSSSPHAHRWREAAESCGHCLRFHLGLPSSITLLCFHRLFLNSSSDLRKVHSSPFAPCQEQRRKRLGWKPRAAVEGQPYLAARQSLLRPIPPCSPLQQSVKLLLENTRM